MNIISIPLKKKKKKKKNFVRQESCIEFTSFIAVTSPWYKVLTAIITLKH